MKTITLLPTAAALWGAAAVTWAATVTLNNGDRLSGDIVAQSAEAITIQHPLLGQIEIPRDQIAGPPADTLADGTEVAAAADPGLLGTGWLSDWKRRVEIGVTGASGKADNQTIAAGITADYEDEQKRWAHKTGYHRNEADGELSEHSLFSTLSRDWLHPDSPWFEFAGGRFDWDEFKDWDYRLSANGGVGYEFINRDNYRLLGRAGIGVNQTFGGQREEFTPEALLGVESQWKISDRQSLVFVNTLYPSLNNSGEFRNLSSLDWVLGLDREAGLGVKVGLSNEYDSIAEDGVDENDFRYTGSLVWDL